jgi:ribosomal-protein-alanine N-acetyltransferase
MLVPDPDLTGPLVLTAGDYRLTPLEPADAADLLAEFSDPRVTAFMDIDPLTEIEEALAIVQWAQSQRALGAGARWAIRDGAGAFLGTAGFNAIVVERARRGEIAYDLVRAAWGRGVMREVLPVLIGFGFERLALNRLEALVTPGNERSCRLLAGLGFVAEGVLAGHGYWKGAFHDQIVHGLTRDRWAATL